MKKRALAVMLAGVMVLGAQTGVWAASDTSDQKEGELTLLMTNSWIDESGASSEEFLKVIKQYEEENPGVKITLQGASQQDIKESFQTAALAGGGADIVVIDNEEGKEAWNYICDLISKGGLVESFKEATTWDKVYESFANGEATFLLGGDWCSTGVENINPDMDYGIAPMVKGKTEATILGGWTWNINVNCKNPELAYDLIQYLNSEKGDSIMSVEGKASARKDYDYAKALEGKDKLKVFAEELSYTKARPAVINEKSIDELITNAILEVDYGQSSAEDALTSLAQKLNENIASNYQ